jgi:hypothetical protein
MYFEMLFNVINDERLVLDSRIQSCWHGRRGREKLTSQPKLCVMPIPLHSASDNIRKSPVSLSWKYLKRSANEVGYERLY